MKYSVTHLNGEEEIVEADYMQQVCEKDKKEASIDELVYNEPLIYELVNKRDNSKRYFPFKSVISIEPISED